MRRILLTLLLASSTVFSQQPSKPNPSEIYEAIQKLNFLGSVLYVAAHPDDENTRLISLLANNTKARTGYLSMTRGDGGQNLIGSEIRELLGVIRTQELLGARKIDGGEQLFTRANDFGYSKHPDETLQIWDKDEVLHDVVLAIRKFRPDVIINRFDHRTPGTTHGHHTSSALLSVEAFDLAGDKTKYSSQLTQTTTWQPKRMFFNTSWWFYGSEEKFAAVDKSKMLTFDIGTYYPSRGLSNSEIASLSRSQHKSQGFGNTGTRGSKKEYIELIKGTMPEDTTNLFDGIDTSWNRIKGGQTIGKILTQVQKNFDFQNPAASVPKLTQAYQLVTKLQDTYWKTIKTKELQDIIAACMGLYLEVVAQEATMVLGTKVPVKIEAINRSNISSTIKKISSPSLEKGITPNTKLINNIGQAWEMSFVPKKRPYAPYWLQEKGSLGMYTVSDASKIGLPTQMPMEFDFELEINEVSIAFSRPLIYKMNDPVKGEVYKPFEITPTVTSTIADKVLIFTGDTPKEIPLTVTAHKNGVSGTASLNIPKKWTISPTKISFDIAQKGATQTLVFTLTPPKTQNEGVITPHIEVGGMIYSSALQTIDYDHIPHQTVITPSTTKVVRLDIIKKGNNIGYIEGAGDVVPESLRQIGYTVTTIAPENISEEALKAFDAIVVGIRAYNTVEQLKFKQKELLKYVKGGGNLIVQYNTNRRLKVEDIAPYTLKLSRDRVTDEHAKVQFLHADHPLLNTPNKITMADFDNWVQERGLYFPNEWAPEFTPLFAMNDKGEKESKGSLLVAPYGKGYYIYTGLSFFREFPAGVPGAYRLFVNMLSIGK